MQLLKAEEWSVGSSTVEPEDTCAAALPSLPAQDSATSPDSGSPAALSFCPVCTCRDDSRYQRTEDWTQQLAYS